MGKNKIQPINKTETVNYGDMVLNNFWKPKSNVSVSGHKEKILQLLNSTTDGFVCIYSETLTDKDIIAKVFDKAKSRVKFYILVNDFSKDVEKICGITLIRYGGINNVGSVILSNPKSNAAKGFVFAGQLTEGSLLVEHFSFDLVKNEILELFKHFCYQFWQKASTEIISNNKNQIQSKTVDILYDEDKFSGNDYVWGTLFDYVEQDKRKNLSGKKIVYIGQEKQLPSEIKHRSEQLLTDNVLKQLLPKEDFENKKPDFKDDGMSAEINYSWRNVPFYLPDNAKDHNLYSNWETEKKKIAIKMESLLEAISKLEKRETTLSKRISRFFLGKKQQFGELKTKIEEIKMLDFSIITKEKRDECIKQINEVSYSIAKHGVDIENENHKANLKDEIERLESQIEDKKKELEEQKAKLDNKVDNKTSDKFIHKVEDDIKKSEKEIKNLENQVNFKQKEIEKIGSENTGGGSSLEVFNRGNKNSQKNSEIEKKFEIQNLPQLPKVGKLWQSNGKSYLAIDYWEDYELGVQESERLKAELCATK
ncbi:MAG: hypothetical protein J6Z01_15675 [Bacteroidales bacterium]|nr:hypothetical protein [Bacteroidales bacterium]